MLRFEVSGPAQPGDGGTVLVLLHGRGSDRSDLQALRPALPEDWVLVTPEAPHPGRPWGYGPGWAWYHHLGGDRVDARTLSRSLEALDAFLQDLSAIARVRPRRIVLGGFSQGGTTSLAYALTHPGAVAATLDFSGFLASEPDLGALPPSPGQAPVFWAHGTRDPQVPWELARKGRERLVAAGVPLTARDYDIGHWLPPEAVDEAVRFLEDSQG